VKINLGQVYQQNYPDDVNPVEGSDAVLIYNAERNDENPRVAGVGYKGAFGDSNIDGGLVYLTFALETDSDIFRRKDFMSAALQYFDLITSVKENRFNLLPSNFIVHQNYPNPFNPTTIIRVELPVSSHLKVEVFNILGQKVAKLADNIYNSGNHLIQWDVTTDKHISSGIYYTKISSKQLQSNVTNTKSIKMILLK
jgi:hypothetical protein